MCCSCHIPGDQWQNSLAAGPLHQSGGGGQAFQHNLEIPMHGSLIHGLLIPNILHARLISCNYKECEQLKWSWQLQQNFVSSMLLPQHCCPRASKGLGLVKKKRFLAKIFQIQVPNIKCNTWSSPISYGNGLELCISANKWLNTETNLYLTEDGS